MSSIRREWAGGLHGAPNSWLVAASVRWLLGAWLLGGCHANLATPRVTRAAAPLASPSKPRAEPPVLDALPSACLGDSVALQLADAGAEVGPGAAGGVLSWRGHLNEDEWVDIIVRFPDGCSGYGECEYSVYLGCGGGRFALVYGPQYSVSLGPDGPAGQRPVALREVRRKDTFEEPGATSTLLHYHGERYTPVR